MQPLDTSSTSLLERNRFLEAQCEQLLARVEVLERDLAVEKLERAQSNAESLKRRVTYSLRTLSVLTIFPCMILFYRNLAGTMSSRPTIPGFPFLIVAMPLGQCLVFLSIMPNEEKLARIVSLVPKLTPHDHPTRLAVEVRVAAPTRTHAHTHTP